MGRVPPFDPETPKGPWLRTLAWSGRQRPVTWFLVNVGNKIDPYLMRATGGRVKSTISAPTVLLTHTGAKSGRKRSTPLAYSTDFYPGFAGYQELAGDRTIPVVVCSPQDE